MRELFEASGFYDGESEGLGDLFLDDVEQVLKRLKVHPRMGRVLLSAIRQHPLRRFSYSLVYRLEEEPSGEQIFILAVAHHKRRPRYWAPR